MVNYKEKTHSVVSIDFVLSTREVSSANGHQALTRCDLEALYTPKRNAPFRSFQLSCSLCTNCVK